MPVTGMFVKEKLLFWGNIAGYLQKADQTAKRIAVLKAMDLPVFPAPGKGFLFSRRGLSGILFQNDLQAGHMGYAPQAVVDLPVEVNAQAVCHGLPS